MLLTKIIFLFFLMGTATFHFAQPTGDEVTVRVLCVGKSGSSVPCKLLSIRGEDGRQYLQAFSKGTVGRLPKGKYESAVQAGRFPTRKSFYAAYPSSLVVIDCETWIDADRNGPKITNGRVLNRSRLKGSVWIKFIELLDVPGYNPTVEVDAGGRFTVYNLGLGRHLAVVFDDSGIVGSYPFLQKVFNGEIVIGTGER